MGGTTAAPAPALEGDAASPGGRRKRRRRRRAWKNGNPPFTQDFRICVTDSDGEYFSQTSRSVVYVANSVSLDYIYATCVHETIHHCLTALMDEAVETGGRFRIDIEQEHSGIRMLEWAHEYIPV